MHAKNMNANGVFWLQNNTGEEQKRGRGVTESRLIVSWKQREEEESAYRYG